ncbi:ankyrin repeat-containing domain protein, partial [Mycena crocata]
MKDMLNEVHDMAVEDKFEKWLGPLPNTTGKQHQTQALHKRGTGEWLLKSEAFVEWQDYGGSLWIQGLSGSGKSVLCSTIMNKLREDRKLARELGHPSAVAFFYFDFRSTDTQVVEIALRRIILQLSSQSPNHFSVLEQQYSLSSHILPSYAELQQILLELLVEVGRTYIVFDALDECDDNEHPRLVDLISLLRGWTRSPVHLLFTSQPRTTFTDHFVGITCIDLQSWITGTHEDMISYVTSELQNNGKLKIWVSQKEDIVDKIVARSSGMFRLAACLLVELARYPLEDLDRTLQNLPTDLFAIYDRFMEAIEPHNLGYAMGVLRWLMYSIKKPGDHHWTYQKVNTIPDLADAVSFKMSSTPTHSEHIYEPSLSRKIRTLIPRWLAGLVTVDSNNQVALAHSSVQQYVLSKRFRDKFDFDLNPGPSHTYIARLCLGYLLHFADNTLNLYTFDSYPLAIYAARNWSFHLINSDDRTVLFPIILRLLDKGSQQYRVFTQLWKFKYCRPQWSCRIPTPLYWCSKNGYTELVRLLLDEPERADINAQSGKYGSALQAAASRGETETVQLLLDHGADVNGQGGYYGLALQAAAWQGSMDTVQLLLDRGAEINTQGGHYGFVLQAAAWQGFMDTVQLLLDRGAEINAQGGEYGSVLQAAALGGSLEIVQLLLNCGADVNVQGGEYGFTLQAAASQGQMETVQLLLDRGADVNAQGGVYGFALQAAALKCKTETVQLLLDHGADVNARGGEYGSALQAAISEGKTETIQLLLDHGADVNAQGGEYGFALQAAARGGDIETVQLLLQGGADINDQGGIYRSALQAAARAGGTETVQLLLERGANIHVQGGIYGFTLQAACLSGILPTVHLLLENGADVNLRGGAFGTALHAASYEGEIAVVRLLLEKGADVNAPGGISGTMAQVFSELLPDIVPLLPLNWDKEYLNQQFGWAGSALEAARSEGHREIVELLLEHGA